MSETMNIGKELNSLSVKINSLEEDIDRINKLLNKVNGTPPNKAHLTLLDGSYQIGSFNLPLNDDAIIKAIDQILIRERDGLCNQLTIAKNQVRNLI